MKNRTPRQRSTAKHDQGYKLLFSHPRIVESFLVGFLGKNQVACLDLSTLERVPSSLISEDLQERHGDIFWRLRWKKDDPSGPSFLYLIVEFQSRPDPSMPVRFLAYEGLLLQALFRKKRGRTEAGLPAVLCIVLYNGKAPWNPPVDLGRLFEPVPLPFRRFLPRLRHLLFDESRLDLDRPELEGNLVAALFRIETCESPDRLPGLLRHAFSLLSREGDPELRRIVIAWLRGRLQNAPPGVKMILTTDLERGAMLEETIVQWEKKVKRTGLVEGRREGRQEGRQEMRDEMRKMLLAQMKLRFGSLPPSVLRKVGALSSAAALRRLGEQVVTAESLADLQF